MRNKKGFTLIELLAIIVILAIIAVITVPIILNIIDNAEKGSVQDSALGYKDALQKYYATKLVQNSEQELPSGYVEISELPSDFTVSGEKPSDGWVKLKNGIVEKYSLKYKDYVVSMDNDRNVISEKQDKVEPHVPNEYQEVEYLESTGTQYIDTGYFPNNNTKVDIKFMALDNPEGAIPLFGARTNADKKSLTVFYRTSTIGRIDYGNYSGSNPTIKFNKDTVHTFVKDKEKNYLDGKYINSNNYTEFSCDYTMYINNVNTSDSSFSKLFSSRLYYTKIYDDGSLARNFVPVIRKSDNKPGMLDFANRTDNLLNPSSISVGNRIVWATGDDYADSTAMRSEYIKVTPGQQYRVSAPCIIIGYDSEKNYLGVMSSGYGFVKAQGNFYTNFTVLEDTGCKFIKLLTYGDKTLSNNLMLNEGSSPLPYEPYGYKFYPNAGTDEFITGPEI